MTFAALLTTASIKQRMGNMGSPLRHAQLIPRHDISNKTKSRQSRNQFSMYGCRQKLKGNNDDEEVRPEHAPGLRSSLMLACSQDSGSVATQPHLPGCVLVGLLVHPGEPLRHRTTYMTHSTRLMVHSHNTSPVARSLQVFLHPKYKKKNPVDSKVEMNGFAGIHASTHGSG